MINIQHQDAQVDSIGLQTNKQTILGFEKVFDVLCHIGTSPSSKRRRKKPSHSGSPWASDVQFVQSAGSNESNESEVVRSGGKNSLKAFGQRGRRIEILALP
jgi:hypothetical protein